MGKGRPAVVLQPSQERVSIVEVRRVGEERGACGIVAQVVEQVHEATGTAEIAARIADELFDQLDAPVKRVAAMDTFCAYQPKLEDVILPQTGHIVTAVHQLLDY